MFVWVCFLLSISCFCAGADLRTVRACYGSDYVIPSNYGLHYTMGKLFFKPSFPLGSPKTLVLDKSKLKDPRYKFTFTTLRIPEVTEKDNGIFSIMQDDGGTYDLLRLNVTDCSPKVVLTYGSTFVLPVLSSDSILDFLPLDSSSEPVVLWNRTNNQVAIEGMGEMNGYSFSIKRVTQKHQGHYTFRNRNNGFVARKTLEVKEHVERYTMETGEHLIVSFGLDSEQYNLDFIPEEDSEYMHLIEKGRVLSDDRVVILGRRAHFSFAINSLEESDSGKFELRDQDNNLALVVWLKVKPFIPWKTYISVGGMVLLLVSSCCCLRKCCCKRNATKRNESSGSGQVVIHQAETHHMTSEPSGPSHPSPPYFQSYAREPVVTISPAAPSGPVHPYQSTLPAPTPPAPTPPSPYPSSNVMTVPEEHPHPQMYNPTGEDPPSFPLAFGCSSSESETQFNLPQRLNFHTALFPSTDLSSSEYVYNSDKLAL